VVVAHRAEPILRATIVEELTNHFHARVELDGFHIAIRNGLWAQGKGLRIWPPAEAEGVRVPGGGKPLISLKSFRFHTPLHYDPNRPIRISVVQLEGLEIDVPPRTHIERNANRPSENSGSGATGLLHFVIASLQCNGANLAIESSKPGRPPMEFAITSFSLKGIAAGKPMAFQAELTNPRPVGIIHTSGSFGPWLVSDPGESPVDGDYQFDHADLSSFKGIAGILNSTGHYSGTLRDIDVNGETDTPDFRLTQFGTALRLHTRFHALVDGTNGDTQLDPVEAVLDHSHFTVQGQVVRTAEVKGQSKGPPPKGHDITLAMNVDRARIEDFLRLASRSGNSLMTGALTMKGDLKIPAGPELVLKRLNIAGAFTLQDARFTSSTVQDRIGDLSARGLGHPKEAGKTSGEDVRSMMSGKFEMAHGQVAFPALQYTVPGAVIDMKGTYGVESGALSFTGIARMQATVSQMVGGWKGIFLKPLDRYFKKDGAGTQVPIHIGGTREYPQFGIDLGRMKTTSPERPGGGTGGTR
jgi:hypothetical protein